MSDCPTSRVSLDVSSFHLATKRDILEIKAEVAEEFKTLYRWLWVMAAGIVTLVLTLGKLVF